MAGGQANSDRGAEVVEAVHWLLRAERTLRTYPAHSEMSTRAMSEVAPRLTAVLPIELEIGPEDLTCSGASVLGANVELPPILSELYRDGIRRIRLDRGMDDAELQKLLITLATPLDPESVSEDYVTRIWEAKLPHVSVAAIDPYLDFDMPDDVLEGKDRPSGEVEDIGPDPQLDVPNPPESAFVISEAERQRMASAVELTAGKPRWGVFLDSLFSLFQTPLGARRREDLGLIIERLFNSSLQRLELSTAVGLFERLVSNERVPAELIERLSASVGDSTALEKLGAAFEAGIEDPELAIQLFVLMSPASVETLCTLFEAAQSARARRFYALALERIGEPAAVRAVSGFRNSGGDLRRAYPKVLAPIKSPIVLRGLLESIADADQSVRREVVRALGVQGEANAVQALLRVALFDDDSGCRVIALRCLGAQRNDLGHEALLERIQSRHFSGLPDEEKDLLFLALGAVGTDDIVPAMAAILKSGWNPFKRSHSDWKRAASALARLGTPAAQQFLQNAVRSRNRELSERCFEALKKLEQNLSARSRS